MTRQLIGEWNLQEAITEQRTETQTGKIPDEIDTSNLHPGNSEVRIVPPTRATLLFSDVDGQTKYGIGRGNGYEFARLQTQIDSQGASQNGLQMKKRSLLKLCFLSVGDLKSASHELMRIGLRCTSLPANDNRSTLSRASSVVSGHSSQGSQERDIVIRSGTGNGRPPGFVSRALSGQPLARSTSTTAITMPAPRLSVAPSTTSLKRTHSEAPLDRAVTDRTKRRQTSMTPQYARSPSLLRRDSSSADMDTPWPPPARNISRSLSRTPNTPKLGSASTLYERYGETDSPVRTPVGLIDPDEPPPRRELPQSVTRHLSRTPSRDARPASANGPGAATAETEAQTTAPYIEPEVAFVAGMNLFLELVELKDSMIRECMSVMTVLGANGNDEAEARLVARYAIEFQARFTDICMRQTNSFCN
ncbi:hypothetical protein Sste5346_003517 [Sporothrix stenoceras]|uniref:Uncharacterized protein n=1 Tax=Sporothrix stenoceras TaxID=5173 RepID=A0ABR3ZD43_9PEZI